MRMHMGTAATSSSAALENFVKKYGAGVLEEMRLGLEAGDTNQAWAEKLGVSRERVRQWRTQFFEEELRLRLKNGMGKKVE